MIINRGLDGEGGGVGVGGRVVYLHKYKTKKVWKTIIKRQKAKAVPGFRRSEITSALKLRLLDLELCSRAADSSPPLMSLRPGWKLTVPTCSGMKRYIFRGRSRPQTHDAASQRWVFIYLFVCLFIRV